MVAEDEIFGACDRISGGPRHTYFEKDLQEEMQIEKEDKYLDFLKLLASNTGQEFIYESCVKEIGVATKSIKSLVSATLRAGIIYFVTSSLFSSSPRYSWLTASKMWTTSSGRSRKWTISQCLFPLSS